MESLYTAWSGQANPFLSARVLRFWRPLLEIRIFKDSGGPAEKNKPHSGPAVGACRETFAFKDGGRVILAVKVMPDAVDAGLWNLFPRFEDLLSLRCALHCRCRPGTEDVSPRKWR